MGVTILICVVALLIGVAVGAVLVNKKLKAKEIELNNKVIELAVITKDRDLLKESSETEREKTQKNFEKQLESMKSVFSESATTILDAKVKNLSESNERDIKAIIDPLKGKMDEFKKAVEDTRLNSVKNTATIESQIKAMIDQTGSISREANNLATALKGSNKMQGNWGEVVLGTLLENMGLREGENFISQDMLRDADGNAIRHEDTDKKLIPDVLLFLPENKAVVIDSKVSLSAYVDYCNAESEPLREDAQKRHCKSMEEHYKELSRKNYAKYVKEAKKDSLQYVVMFTPNEGAFQLFYQNNKELWHKAFENNVIIAGESNLFAMLRIIEAAWVQIQQQKNLEVIMETSGELLQRVGAFVNTFDDVGKAFEKTMEQYQTARKKLIGRQGVATTAVKLGKLGVNSKDPIREMLLLSEEGE